jgi:adenosylmethionine-8-amino-7-oxononanoate aminotransferase
MSENYPILKKFPNDPPRPYVDQGEGIYIHLEDGRKLLDATSGWTSYAVLGYSRKDVLDAMKAQMDRFCHMDYNIWANRTLEELAHLLLSRAPAGLDKVYFGGTSGSDAIEAAMKLSYHVHHDEGHPTKTNYIFREQSFSGATLQSMSVSDLPILNFFDPIKPKNYAMIDEHNPLYYKRDDETLDDYARRGAADLEKKIIELGSENVCAFVGETLMGSLRGDVPPAPGYWKYCREVCDKYDVHIILDEVYCGLGRSGRIYCCDYDNFRPDFVCVGKNSAGGYASMSAVITNSHVEDVIAKGSGRIQLGHTFQGFSLGAAAMLAVQKVVHTDEMLAHITDTGQYVRDTIDAELSDHPFYRETRGRGFNMGFEYDCPEKHLFSLKLQQIMQDEHSILINAKWHRTTFCLPFIITREETDLVLDKYIDTFKKVAGDWSSTDMDMSTLPGSMGGVKMGA